MSTGAPWEGEERFLRALMENTSDIVLVLDAEGNIRYENAAVGRVLGYRPEERIGRSAFERVHPDDVARVKESYAAALERPGGHPPVRFRLRHADGSWRHVESVRTNLIANPAVRGMVNVLRDVTEREEAEEALRGSRATFRAVFDGSAIGMALVDARGRLEEANPALQEMLGYGDEELRNLGFDDVTHPDDVADDVELFGRMMAGELDHFTLEKRYVRKDGSVMWGHLTSSAIRDVAEKPLLMVGMVEDVTERKRAEEALEASEERYRRQARELHLLHQVRTALAQELELPAVFRTVVEAIAQTYGYTQVSAYLLREGTSVLQHQVGYEQVIEAIPTREGVSGRVVLTGEPLLVEDVRADPAFLGAIEGIVSEVCVPLFDEGKVVGFLNVESTGGVRLAEDDLRLMTALAEHAGMAISRARLHGRIRESEERFRSLIQNAPDVIMILDANCTILYDSPAIERMLGYEPGERLGTEGFDYVHPEDEERARRTFAEVLDDPGTGKPVEYRLRHKDGSWRHVESVRTNLLADPAVGGIVINCRDVTERTEAEAATREAEERYRTLVEQVPVAAYCHAPALRTSPGTMTQRPIDYMSPRVEDILGYPPEAFTGETGFWAALIHPDDKERVLAEDIRTDETGDTFEAEYRVGRADGGWAWVRDASALVRDGEGRPLFWQGVLLDITERKRAEEALEESEERYRAVMEQSVEAIYLYDVETRGVFESNAAFQRMVGYTADELLGMPIYDFIGHEKEDVDANVRRSLAEGRRHIGERRYRRKDGSVILVDTSASVISYRGERAVCAISRDITERSRVEEALRTSEERFRSLIQNASDLITIVGEDGTVRYDSPAIEHILGYEPGDRVGKSAFDYAHPDDRERVEGTFSEVLRDPRGRPPSEFRVRHKDGSWRQMEVLRSNLLDDPAVGGVVINARDVTERKEAEAALRKSEERFRSVVQNSSEIVKIVAPDGTLKYASPAFGRILGHDPDEAVGMNVLDHVHPDDVSRVVEETEKTIGEPGIGRNQVQYRFRHADGSWRCIESVGTYLLDEPSVEGVVINARDVTERVRAEKGLRESEERYRAVVEQCLESIYLFNPETKRVLESNAAFQRLLGYSSDEMKRMTLYDFVAHEKADIDLNVRCNLEEGQRYVGERTYRRKDGSLITVQVNATVIPYQDGEAICAIARDITERKRLEEELTRQAFHDSLTGLPNRSLFLDRLKHALARAGREGASVAVLFVDLDDFKAINDSLGHDVGDQLLRRFGDRLASCVRPGDTVGRLFGDEFVVLLEAPAEVDEARLVAERVMESLRTPFELGGEEVYVNSSIGISSGPSDEDVEMEQPRELLRRADLAMYAAKSTGKGGHATFDPSMRTQALERMELENQLRRAVEREEFEVHYQPVVETNTGKIEGLEALVRWRHPERGLVAAGEFIERAEETGLIRPIGAWVLEEACGQALRWNERLSGRPFAIMVNFSASQFAHQADLIPKVLGESGLEPGRLILEITERTAMDDAEFALGKLRTLKDMGVDFAIDDYGTGYSCLRYLKLMPVDILKIDRSFVSDLGKDPEAEAIVKGTIDLAHALGLKVIAEGVETAEQLERLKRLRCDLVQGYYLSFPLPEPQASALLAKGFLDPRG